MKRLVFAFIVLVFIIEIFTMQITLIAKQETVTNVEQYQIKENQENLKEVEEYLKQREEEMNKIKERERAESPARRFEVMFFSSGAMVYWSSYFFVRIFAQIAKGTSSEMNNTYWYYIGFNAIGVATYVAIKDYYDRKAKFDLEQNNSGNFNQRDYRLTFLAVRF